MNREVLVISAVWCPSCLLLNKHLNRLMKEGLDINIKKLDYDLDEEEVLKYNIGNTLPVIIIKDNNDQEISRLVGEKSYEEILTFIKGTIK